VGQQVAVQRNWVLGGLLLIVLSVLLVTRAPDYPVGEAFTYSADGTGVMTRSGPAVKYGRDIKSISSTELSRYSSKDFEQQTRIVNSWSDSLELLSGNQGKIDSLLLDDQFLTTNEYVSYDGRVPVIILADGPVESNSYFEKNSDSSLLSGSYGTITKGGLAWARDSSNIQKVYLDQKVKLNPLDGDGGAESSTEVSEISHQSTVIESRTANANGIDGAGVVIAIVDTGVDDSHPDLVGKVIRAKSFVSGEDSVDRNGHGTHVAGIVAGTGAASNGMNIGIAPGANLINAKVLDASGSGYTSGIIEGMGWAVEEGADIISMSLGGDPMSGLSDPMTEAANAVVERGVVVVVAAGNSGW